MTFADVSDLLKYWKEVPPAPVSLARIVAQLGKVFFDGDAPGASTPSAPPKQEGTMEDLMRMFSNGVITGG